MRAQRPNHPNIGVSAAIAVPVDKALGDVARARPYRATALWVCENTPQYLNIM